MKINKVTVKNLFGIFTHEVPINNETGITIIIGDNGIGKTVFLEMIEAFFKGNFLYFNNVVFDEMIFDFDDKIKWILKKEDNKEGLAILNLSQKNKNKIEHETLKLIEYDNEQIELFAQRIARSTPNLRRIIGLKGWEDRKTRERFESAELIHKFGSLINQDLFFGDNVRPLWFTEKYEKIKISLIETQRLISIEKREDLAHEKTVEKYSNDLSQLIRVNLTLSTELSSKLDRTYPNRLIDRIKRNSNFTKDHLNNKLEELESKRKTLDAVGLIEIEKDSNISEIESPDNVIIDVLMLYVEDSFEKLKIFDTISRKIEILLDIINKRFKHKKLFIDKEEGFLFKSTQIKNAEGKYENIPVTKLSSGEQNELVLFYSLLFRTERNSLILIDEPEVSLHISWQNSFIEDLKAITKLNELDVVIATHSPDIIANNWNLKVELKGLE